uniref:Uncharacterized protein n=1 Tax=Physcomitrium patens TaxID=3218 RepID=A0A2K1ILV6_PHYPA|nr:hypothetical protein PHYPA_026569 [Physcomitrium patens]
MQGMNRHRIEMSLPSLHGMHARGVIMGRRAAPATPVSKWKVFNHQLYDAIPSTTSMVGGNQTTASARKLAASLWRVEDLPLSAHLPACHNSPNLIPCSSPSQRGIIDSPFSQPDYVLTPETCRTRNPHLGKVEKRKQLPCRLFASPRKGDGEIGLNVTGTMSQELLRIFNQIRLLEEHHNSSLHLTNALQRELMRTHARVRELEKPHRMARRETQREIEDLKRKISDAKLGWKTKEKERIKDAVLSVKKELEEERRARLKLQSANRRLTNELMEAQAVTSKALQEFESERKARLIIEEVCNELAQKSEDEKLELEKIKRETQQVREALEEERCMLQMAEVWREERVQMKLGEAKVALEEKSAALNVMQTKLESFLRATRDANRYATLRDAQVLHNIVSTFHPNDSNSTFPPNPCISSLHPRSEYMQAASLVEEPSQEERKPGLDLFHYSEA